MAEVLQAVQTAQRLAEWGGRSAREVCAAAVEDRGNNIWRAHLQKMTKGRNQNIRGPRRTERREAEEDLKVLRAAAQDPDPWAAMATEARRLREHVAFMLHMAVTEAEHARAVEPGSLPEAVKTQSPQLPTMFAQIAERETPAASSPSARSPARPPKAARAAPSMSEYRAYCCLLDEAELRRRLGQSSSHEGFLKIAAVACQVSCDNIRGESEKASVVNNVLAEVARRDVYDQMAWVLEEVKWVRNHNRRNVSPDGGPVDSFTLGAQKNYCKGLMLSTQTHCNKLTTRLLNAAMRAMFPECTWTSIQCNRGYTAKVHRDRGNTGLSIAVGLGEYDGGELCVEHAGGSTSYIVPPGTRSDDAEDGEVLRCNELSIRKAPKQFDGHSRHFVNNITSGLRYSLIYFTRAEVNKDQISSDLWRQLDELGFPLDARWHGRYSGSTDLQDAHSAATSAVSSASRGGEASTSTRIITNPWKRCGCSHGPPYACLRMQARAHTHVCMCNTLIHMLMLIIGQLLTTIKYMVTQPILRQGQQLCLNTRKRALTFLQRLGEGCPAIHGSVADVRMDVCTHLCGCKHMRIHMYGGVTCRCSHGRSYACLRMQAHTHTHVCMRITNVHMFILGRLLTRIKHVAMQPMPAHGQQLYLHTCKRARTFLQHLRPSSPHMVLFGHRSSDQLDDVAALGWFLV